MKTLFTSLWALWSRPENPSGPLMGISILNATHPAEWVSLKDQQILYLDAAGPTWALRADLDPAAASQVQSILFEMQTGSDALSFQDFDPPFMLESSSASLWTRPGPDQTLSATALNAEGLALGRYTVTITLQGPMVPPLLSAASKNSSEILARNRVLPVTPQKWYINVGGTTFTDSKNRTWEADALHQYYNTGQAKSTGRQIFNTVDDLLYQSWRFANASAVPVVDLVYSISMPPSTYQVTLHFSENSYTSAGGRTFDVWIEGALVTSSLDVYARAGGARIPFLISGQYQVLDGALTLQLIHRVANPMINAIQVEELPNARITSHPSARPSVRPSARPSTSRVKELYSLLINTGGGAYVDSTSRSWVRDQYYNSGLNRTSGKAIYQTADDLLYQSYRYADTKFTGDLAYQIPLATSLYQVALHFCETFWTATNQRVFDVWVEGKLIRANLDVVAQVGQRTPFLIDGQYAVTDGFLSITLTKRVDTPMISAIEIYEVPGYQPPSSLPSAAPSASVAPTISLWSALINCGGAAFQDSQGDFFEADSLHAYYNTGTTFAKTTLPIKNTNDALLYQTERSVDSTKQPPLQYSIPVPAAGKYRVVLYFAEIYFSKAGKRVFDVWVEKNLLIANFDIVAKVGYATAMRLETNATVSDGALTIDFVSQVNNPKISAFAVWQLPYYRRHRPTMAPVSRPMVTAMPQKANRTTSHPVKVPSARPSSRPSSRPTVYHPANQTIAVRVNCGGDNYTDSTGAKWEADSLRKLYSSNTAVYTKFRLAIKGTADQTLFQSQRYDTTTADMFYSIPLPVGTYQVKLLFAELSLKAVGARIFDVWVEEGMLYPGLDIYSLVGYGSALTLNTTAKVIDGSMTIRLVPKVYNPEISAIEVVGIPDPKNVIASQSPSAAPSVNPFQPIRINAGGNNYTDVLGNVWEGDNEHKYYVGGLVQYLGGGNIKGIPDTTLYRYLRYNSNANFSYVIPISQGGSYKVTLFFADLIYINAGSRIFNIDIEGQRAFTSVDIAGIAGGANKVLQLDLVVPVTDGALNIDFLPVIGNPLVNAIQILRNGPHLAHAVPGGPYTSVDVDGNGVQAVAVDGSQSHTHAFGKVLNNWTWIEAGSVIGSGQQTSLTLSVGQHQVYLSVTDNAGNNHIETTTATVLSQGYPLITSLTPSTGDVIGGNNVTISGFGFNFTANQTTIYFGTIPVTGSALRIINSTTIVVIAPAFAVGLPVDVKVSTPIGTSTAVQYTYVAGVPIQFASSKIFSAYGPSSLAFGPDGKLYVGSVAGMLYKITLDDNFNVANVITSSIVANSEPGLARSILGVALDPMDRSANPAVYVTHSSLFHGSCESFRGLSINGKVSKVSGADLTVLQHVVTGLPVSDHDHGINGLEFNDNGDLHIQVGGNTNAGIPGALSGCGLQADNFFSGAGLVAHLSTPGYDGNLTYNNVTGAVNPGQGVEVFAPGLRNSFDVVLHSNGNLYATDNGPNTGYGAKSTTCNSQSNDPFQADKLVWLQKGRYYGHPNRPRAALTNRPDQCEWRPFTDPTDALYTAPLAMLESSTNGIVEFHGEHFTGQLRYNLILGKYKGPLYRVILNANGTQTAFPPVLLAQDGGLDVTQGPDGSLFTTQEDKNAVNLLKPVEPASTVLTIKTVFTRRGPVAGGYEFRVYGQLLNVQGAPTVLVGTKTCPVTSSTATKILCTMPSGTAGATVDVKVTSGTQTSTMKRAFRYITGLPTGG